MQKTSQNLGSEVLPKDTVHGVALPLVANVGRELAPAIRGKKKGMEWDSLGAHPGELLVHTSPQLSTPGGRVAA